ncbi:MAG TPA: AsmA family protein, partial [Steroidobacteraceae bacterium]|nr:AsmA family protein [Steroidobacteraceae bacterium]
MRTTLKWTGIGLGALCVVVVLVLAFFDWNLLRGPISRIIAARIDRPVRIAKLHVVLLSGRPYAELSGLQIGNPVWAGGGRMADIERVRIELAWGSLLKAQLVLPRVEIDKPDLYLFSNTEGRANWLFGATAPSRHAPESSAVARANNKPTRLPVLRTLVIEAGRLRVIDQERKLVFTGTVGTRGAGASAAEAFQLLGSGQLNDKPFSLRVGGGPLIWAESHKPYPFEIEVRADGTHASAHGTVPRPFDLGQLDVTLSAAGEDLADLYYL